MTSKLRYLKKYTNKCVGQRDNLVEKYGFPATNTFPQMLALAMEHNCNLIQKSGMRGKWYLKNKDYKKIKKELKDETRHNRKNHICYLIKYDSGESGDFGESCEI